MKYLIDKEKLDERIYKLLAGDGKNQADNVEGIALCALRGCLVPYEEKKEECECHDHRCMKCNGEGGKEGEVLLHGFPYNYKRTCNHCNGTGKEPRKEDVITAPRLTREDVRAENFGKYECPPKCSMWNHEEDTRTHAWETPDTDKKIAEL